MDCFVEFDTVAAANETVTRINRVHEMGRSPRMGSRHVEVAMSSQDELLKALFPHAKCLQWVDAQPVLQENKDLWSTGFQGFLTDEEMFCVLRHAEVPHRVRLFSSCCLPGLILVSRARLLPRCPSALTSLSSAPCGRYVWFLLLILLSANSFSSRGVRPTCTPSTLARSCTTPCAR